jgi:glutamate/tyrosine decarboxylase-like PLP-dependent enzyme
MIRKEIFERMSATLGEYLARNRAPDTPVVEYRAARELRRILDLHLERGQGSSEKMWKAVEQYLRFAVRTGHPQYFNQLWAGFTVPGFVGESIASATNTSMYTYEVAPVATLMEIALTEELLAMIGYPEGEGMFVTGGSNANLVAMLCARHAVAPEVRSKGMASGTDRPLDLFCSDEAHYSIQKAANVLGIGADHVIEVETDGEGRMIPGELDRALEESIRRGHRPFFVTATAGTTVRAAFDPIDEIAAVTRPRGIWLHVDGALGGSVLLSRRHRGLLRGAEQADSFAWDLHKIMGMPLMTSLIFLREKGGLHAACSTEHSEYIFHEREDAEFDLGPKSLQCGRRVNVLKAWLSWQYFGRAGYERRMDTLFDLAEYAEGIVRESPGMEMVVPRQSVAVCFRVVPPGDEDPGAFNIAVREKLLREGRCMLNYARLEGGKITLRLVFANPELDRRDVDRFFGHVLEASGALSTA